MYGDMATAARFPPSPGGRSSRMRNYSARSRSNLISKDSLEDKGGGGENQKELNFKTRHRNRTKAPNWQKWNMMSLRNLILLGIVAAALVCGIIALVLGIVLSTEAADLVNYECLTNSSEPTCYGKDTQAAYRFYGTKTTYKEARNFLENKTTIYVPPNCQPRFFYLVSRHATRYPDEKYIVEFMEKLPMLQQRIADAHEAGHGMLCDKDLNKIRYWKPLMKPSDDNRISSTGKQEAKELAKRFRQRFPHVLGEKYSTENYKFAFTSRNRTLETLQAFVEGLLGEEIAQTVNYDKLEDEDGVLQFHKECKSKLKAKGIDVKSDHPEVVKFLKSKMVTDIAVRVSQKLGFTVDMEEVGILRRACVFEYALYLDSPWCALFETDDMKILEYAEDLDDYYADGYGNPVNYEQACPVVRDLIAYLDRYTNVLEPKVVLKFSHAGAVKKIIARFGLFKDDEHLLADDFCKQEKRKWRSSLLCPFTANFAVVLYDCLYSNNIPTYRIGAFVQEEPVILKGCSQHLCDYSEFIGHYRPMGTSCDLDDICSA